MMKHTLQMDQLIEMNRKFIGEIQPEGVPLTRAEVSQQLAEIARKVGCFCKRSGDLDDLGSLLVDNDFDDCADNPKVRILCGIMAPCHIGSIYAELPPDLIDDNALLKELAICASQVSRCFCVLNAWKMFPLELRDVPTGVIRIMRQYAIHVCNK